MKKYEVTLTGHYEKSISVYADNPEDAKRKIEIILFNTDLIDFADEDFVRGEANIIADTEGGCEEAGAEREKFDGGCCGGCPYFCPMCGECMYENEE